LGKIGVSIITFPFLSFSEALQKIESLGFKAVELWTEFPEVWKLDFNGRINLFKELLPSLNFDLSIHTPITDLNISSCHPKIQEISLKEIEETLILANKTGIKKAVVHGGFKPKEKPFNKLNKTNLQPYLNQTSNGIKQILKQGEELGVEILVENAEYDEQHKILRTYDNFQTITKEINREFSIVYDISHSLPAGIKKSKEFITKMKHRIKEVHLSFYDKKTKKHHLPLTPQSKEALEILNHIKKHLPSSPNLIFEIYNLPLDVSLRSNALKRSLNLVNCSQPSQGTSPLAR